MTGTHMCIMQNISSVLVTPLEAQKVTKSAVVSRPYHTPPPLPPLPPFPSAEVPAAPASTRNSVTFEITSELPKPTENTEFPVVPYKPVRPSWTQDGLTGRLGSTTEPNKRIPIPTDPTPLILQPPTAIYIPKKPSVMFQSDKPAVRLTTVKSITTSTAPPFTVSPLTISQRLNPVVTMSNETAITKSPNIVNTKTLSSTSTTLKMPTVPNRNSSLISTTLLLAKQSSRTLKTTPEVIKQTTKPIVLAVPSVTQYEHTARTSTPTESPLIIRQFTVPEETQDITEQLNYSELTTRVPSMKVTRGKEITIIVCH